VIFLSVMSKRTAAFWDVIMPCTFLVVLMMEVVRISETSAYFSETFQEAVIFIRDANLHS
jgi:hypothetical protein